MHSRRGSRDKIGTCRIGRLVFAHDMEVLDSLEYDIQYKLNMFAAKCCNTRMGVSVAKTEALVCSRNLSQYTLYASGTSQRQL